MRLNFLVVIALSLIVSLSGCVGIGNNIANNQTTNVSIISSSSIISSRNSIPDEWKSCEEDSDCVETKSGCCSCTMGGIQTGINKRYISQWNERLSSICPKGIVCIALYNCKNGSVKCYNNACEYIILAE